MSNQYIVKLCMRDSYVEEFFLSKIQDLDNKGCAFLHFQCVYNV